MPIDRRQASGALTELALYAVSALISFALLNNVLKKLDPNQQNNKQARGSAGCAAWGCGARARAAARSGGRRGLLRARTGVGGLGVRALPR
jgi:hypothetical protein